jgi:transposase
MTGNHYKHKLTDAQWGRIKKYFDKPQKTGRPRSDMRKMADGVLWISRNGATWRAMPAEYGPYTTVYGWYARWDEEGLLQKILDELKADADPQDMGIDSTCAKVHQHAAGAKKGRQTQTHLKKSD